MAGNIIPAIATTNAMTASICVLQAFKVMRNELNKAKMVFLAPNGTERRLTTEALSPPNPSCPVCSVAQSTLLVDANRATLNDLVEGVLRLQLGYGEEFSINSEAGLLYDPEEDTNLAKTFSDLGLKNDTSITIIDDADEDAKVNLVLHISEKELDSEAKPIDLAQNPDIPLKPKVAPTETNGDAPPVVTNGLTNGVTESATGGLKRTADQAGLEDELIKKRGKVAAKPDDDVVLVDDANDGIILIDD